MQHGFAQQQQPPTWTQGAPQANGVSHKRTKTGGAMVTTKYAPPPGYVPPVAPSYGAWPYGVAPAAQQYYAGYPQAQYGQYPGQFYGYPQAPYGYPPQHYQQHAVPYTVGSQSAHPVTGYPPGWPQAYDAATAPEQRARHNSAPSIGHDAHAAMTKIAGPNDELDEADEEYCEFTRPCYYASRESEIVKELSIGLVHAYTARPSNVALPATWTEANEIALKPGAPEKYDENACVSGYHSEDAGNRELLAARHADDWELVQDDLIFKAFDDLATSLMPTAQLIKEYRNRHDQAWADAKPDHTRRVSRPEIQRNISGQSNKKRVFSETDAARLGETSVKKARQDSVPDEPQQNETAAADSAVSKTIPETQDEILARLGVTGAAKPVNPIPMQQQRSHTLPPVSQDVAPLRSIPEEPAMGLVPADNTDEDDESMDDEPIQPVIINPKESRWTRMAREYQMGQKRAYRIDEADEDDEPNEKRRK